MNLIPDPQNAGRKENNGVSRNAAQESAVNILQVYQSLGNLRRDRYHAVLAIIRSVNRKRALPEFRIPSVSVNA
jgi:hypothetical protein